MDKTTLYIIIGASVLFVLIVLVVIGRMSSRRKAKKLHENLKKIKIENENFDKDDRISLPDDYKESLLSENDTTQSEAESEIIAKGEAKIEDYQPFEQPTSNIYPKMEEEFNSNDFGSFRQSSGLRNFESNIKEDDFDKFMNEHSYSRRIFNRPLLEKIKNLPPDVRMLLLGNILDRHDD